MKTRLKSLRKDKGINQNEIAKYLNISQVAYSYYEIEKRNIPIEILEKLADLYKTSIDYLIYRTDIKEPYPKSKIKPNLE